MKSSLDALLYRVLLGDPDLGDDFNEEYQEYAVKRAAELIDAHNDLKSIQKYEVRLRLAGHLCPREAFNHDPQSRKSRHRIIKEYLEDSFSFEEDDADELSRELSKTLDVWEEGRKSVTSFKNRLLKKQNNQCAHCHVDFSSEPRTSDERDMYKPYHPKTELRHTPEVDHIEPVSTFGTNKMDNLQVLCRLCNHGKGDGLGVDVSSEIDNAGKSVKEVSWKHRARIFYQVVKRHSRTCQICGSSDAELTIRRINPKGAYVRSNLIPVCVSCVDWNDA
ncbi:HNH endonuclease [Halorussus litoreus]|uniref:HNH endonuclease n=1 Tax=Halorussus litoreus TaxID=1710536 RepID=UPI000E24700B|nr:HNH endonuclease [Halorussus litoreus]